MYGGRHRKKEEILIFSPGKNTVLKNDFIFILAGLTPSTLNEGMKEDGLSIKSNLLPNENQVCCFTLFEKIPNFCKLPFDWCTISFCDRSICSVLKECINFIFL